MTGRPAPWRIVAVLPLVALAAACGGPQDAATSSNATAATADADAPIPATASPLDALPDAVRQQLDQPFSGDLDAMVKRRSSAPG